MVRTPDGHGKLELAQYHTPAAIGEGSRNPPPNTLGLHRVMPAVDDIDDTVARLRPRGAELIGGVTQYIDCIVGPDGGFDSSWRRALEVRGAHGRCLQV